MEQHQVFDPSRYLININGQQYLEVKWRLVWLRNVFPDASVTTELVSHADGRAIFKANASLPNGASSTGWGSESESSFPEYIEAAETKALGRCLAALGFGSQFCSDFELAEAHGVLADSPVRPASEYQRSGSTAVNIEQPMTSKQHGLIQILARDLHLSSNDLDELAHHVANTDIAALSRREASNVIEELQARGAAQAS
jgi:hypothetical protein